MSTSRESLLLVDSSRRLAPAFPMRGLADAPAARQTVARTHHVPTTTLEDSYATELAALRKQSTSKGHLDGFAQGMAEAESAVAQVKADLAALAAQEQTRWTSRLSTAVQALVAAATQLDQRSAPALDDLVEVVTASTMELTSALLQRELACATDPGLDAIRRALRLCPQDASVRIKLNPADLDRLDRTQLGTLSRNVTVSADPTVEPGGALAESGARRVDAQLGVAMIRVRKVLEA
jgi:flagellar assembly protein FliH